MIKRILLLTSLLYSSQSSALNLIEVIDTALQRHPDYPLASATAQASKQYQDNADSLLGADPTLELSVTSDWPGSDFGYEEYIAGLSLPVALPGQRQAKQRVADTLGRMGVSQRQQLKWKVAGEVLQRAWEWRISHVEAQQALKQWTAARALKKDIDHRFRAGETSRIDLLRAQKGGGDRELAYKNALTREKQARIAWQNYTGLEQLPNDLEAFSQQHSERSLALEHHPALITNLAILANQQAKVLAAQQQRRSAPVVSLFAKRDRGMRGEAYTDSLGIGLSIPLGSHSQAAPAIADAEQALSQVRAELENQRRQLELNIEQAGQSVERAQRLLNLARNKHELARDRLRLAKRAFELGEMDLYKLLLARKEAAAAEKELQLHQLKLKYVIAHRNHLLGVIPQ